MIMLGDNANINPTVYIIWQMLIFIIKGTEIIILLMYYHVFLVYKQEEPVCFLLHYIFLFRPLSVSPSLPLLPPSCGIMGIVQVACRSTLCPRRSRRRRAVMTCSSARSPSSPSQLIPALHSSAVAVEGVGESVGSLISAPCNVSGSGSHPATSALPLLLPCLFYGCALLPRRMTDTECKSVTGRCLYPSGLQETHEYTLHTRDMGGNISVGYFRSIWMEQEPPRNKHASWKYLRRCHIVTHSDTGDDILKDRWHRTRAKHWTFKPSGAECDLEFNSELDQGHFTVWSSYCGQ